MIFRAEIKAGFSYPQNGVNSRTADVDVSIIDPRTKRVFKHFAICPEIVRETETDDYFEVDFRRCYVGREEGRILSSLGVQRFMKVVTTFREQEVDLNYSYAD